jgi:hypothetical protein
LSCFEAVSSQLSAISLPTVIAWLRFAPNWVESLVIEGIEYEETRFIAPEYDLVLAAES